MASFLNGADICAAKKAVESGKGMTIALRCPHCESSLGSVAYVSSPFGACVQCPACSFLMTQEQGVWKALPPGRLCYYSRFIDEYQIVREKEGRGSPDAHFYLELPYKDVSGCNRWQWTIRSRTYRYLERAILPELEGQARSPLLMLDLGSGNGWLSYRLALRGNLPIAVDLLTNSQDGLGAASHYLQRLPHLFPRFQAEIDRLPFASSQFHCAVFNSSFHYSEDYVRTVSETIRCLVAGGMIIIADSPFYQAESAGQQMLCERRRRFNERFGFASESLASLEYLTWERLVAIEKRFGITWQIHRPHYGLRWNLRPWIAKWKKRREPAQFRIYTARVKNK